MSDHERWADAAGAYVLGAMAPDERRDYEEHLVGCARCRQEVDELSPAAEALPMASAPVAPPAALKDRLMAEVEREAALLADAGDGAERAPRRPRPRLRRRPLLAGWRLAPAAAAVLAAGVLAGFVVAGIGSDTQTYTATVDGRQAPGASAELQVADGEATLVAQNLPDPPGRDVYQVWIMRPGSDTPEPTSALFLPRSDGSAVTSVPGAGADADAVLVTHEPPGGSDAPSAEPLLSMPLS